MPLYYLSALVRHLTAIVVGVVTVSLDFNDANNSQYLALLEDI